MDRNWKAPYKRSASGFWQIDLREFQQFGMNPGRRSMRDPGHAGAGLWWEQGRKTKNKAEALSWLQDYWELCQSMTTGQPAGGRFTRDLVEEYTAQRAALFSSSTAVKSRQAAEELYADHGGAALGAVSITTTLERLRREPKQRGAGHKSAKHLAGIFDQLRTFIKWLNEAPRSAGIEMPTRPSWLAGANKVRQKFGYTADQVEAILEQADLEGVGNIARLCLATGVRIMEAFGMKWEDIEQLEDGTLLVNVAAQADRTDMEQRIKTKSDSGRWTIVGQHGAELALGVGRTGFIIDREQARTCDAAYTRALKAAGLKRTRELWHMLRHTFALNTLEQGASYDHLSVWLGHSGPHITRANYPGMDLRSRALHGLRAMNAQKATVTPAVTV